ncbi:MAG TPA: class I SAM-dependent methyltransferase [Chloroflexota bacterium]|nr:class I SAM-dependent methyltransferase [Chloroflexota bacterium]
MNKGKSFTPGEQTIDVCLAYDAVADRYDTQVTSGGWMRAALWRHYRRRFRPGATVLDVGCGTGLDAIYLAMRGVRVMAVDGSSGMLGELRRKLDRTDRRATVDTALLDAMQLDLLPANAFDGMIAAFAVLNTVPDLDQFAASAARRLRPGSHLIAHLLTDGSLGHVFSLALGLPTRNRQSQRATRIGEARVIHRVYSVAEISDRFTVHGFRIADTYALGVMRPDRPLPPVLRLLFDWLEPLDTALGHLAAFRESGPFFVVDLIRTGTGEAEEASRA